MKTQKTAYIPQAAALILAASVIMSSCDRQLADLIAISSDTDSLSHTDATQTEAAQTEAVPTETSPSETDAAQTAAADETSDNPEDQPPVPPAAPGEAGPDETAPAEAPAPEAPKAAEGWTCPQCGNINTMNFCANCGTKKPAAPAACANCGQAFDPANPPKFCPNCGTKVE